MDRRIDPSLSQSARRSARLLVALLLVQGGLAPAASASEAEILRPEAAFRYTLEAEAQAIRLRWTIEPGHYLYRERMGVESRSPAIRLGEPQMPPGQPYEDEFFGEMEIYRDQAEILIPLVERPARRTRLELDILSQGCADIGLCYPPQRWTAALTLPQQRAAPAGAPAARPGWLGGSSPAADDQPLPAEQAFRPVVEISDPFSLQVSFSIAPGYYLYRHSLGARSQSAGVQAGQPVLPPGVPKWDEEFGDTVVFYDELVMTVPLSRSGPDSTTLELLLEYQGCKENSICYPPETREFTLLLPAASPLDAGRLRSDPPRSEQDRLSALISDGNMLAVMGLFAGLGLLLAFTPCVLPMVPILSGIIVGQGPQVTTRRAFLLSVTFVLGMALTYTAAGAAFAAAGQQIQGLLQQPWVIIGVALLFVLLALAMFGFYELRIPSGWQTRLNSLSGRQRGGSYIGAAIMGMLSALVVSTCVTPPLVAALAVIAQAGDVARGALALFALSIGMGLPLIAVGTSAGRLLPRAGAWMDAVKAIFGILLLGVAVWMLERLLPGPVTLALWAMLLVVAGVFLGAFHTLDRTASPARQLGKGLGVVALLYGAALLIGALAGNDNPWQPLRLTAPAGEAGTAQFTSGFRLIKTVEDLERELAAASASGTPVMLDFYADWCVSCKEMERYTFSDPLVRSTLAQMTLLKADVTRVDAADQALMRRFGIVGPPTIVFFDAAGAEQRAYRLVGFKSAADFLDHLRAFLSPPGTTA